MIDGIGRKPPGGLPPSGPPKPFGHPLIAPGRIVQCHVGSYSIIEQLTTKGGMSNIFKVLKVIEGGGAGPEYLLKKMLDLAPYDNDQKADLTIRFMREINVLREINKIKDPRFPRLIDFELIPEDAKKHGESPSFYIMERIQNVKDLHDAVSSWGAFNPLMALKIISRVVSALYHVARIVSLSTHSDPARFSHRDIKPDNILLSLDEITGNIKRVVLIDLGIMRLPDSNLTKIGTIMGTRDYFAPETIPSSSSGLGALVADQRSDIFSLGCVLFELVTGRAAFDFNSSFISVSSLSSFTGIQGMIWAALVNAGYIDSNGTISDDKFNEGSAKFNIGLDLNPQMKAELFNVLRSAYWATRFYDFGRNPAPYISALYQNKPANIPDDLWQTIFIAMNPDPAQRFISYADFYVELSNLSCRLGGEPFLSLS